LGTLSEKKIEESQELARDVAIAVGRHMGPLRGKR